MKGNRLFSRVNLLLLTMLIVACQGGNVSTSKNSNSNSSKDNVNTSSSIDISKNQLLISEYVEGSANFAVELYNFTDKDANLSDYTFNVYGKSEVTPTSIIQLNGILKAKETYVIVSSLTVSEELKAKADLLSDKLIFNGGQAMSLAYKGTNVDVLGNIGYTVVYAKDVTLVRKDNHITPTPVFDEYDWVRYLCDDFSYLGNFGASVSEEELLAGPKLTDEFLNAPFFKEGSNNQIGAGGLAKVRVYSYIDGDTTCFFYPEELGLKNGLKVRYQNINTPESYTGGIQEWGIPAKEYTKYQLSKANEIYVQSIKDGSIYETYDRLLGWVWIDGELLNFKIVKEGYSLLRFNPINTMFYKGVTYSNYLYHAELYAKRNGLKLHGEKDHTWDYEKWESLYA